MNWLLNAEPRCLPFQASAHIQVFAFGYYTADRGPQLSLSAAARAAATLFLEWVTISSYTLPLTGED